MTGARRTLLAAVGVAGVAVAVGVVAGVAPASLSDAVSGLDATLATGVLGAALVGYALRRRRSASEPGVESLAEATAAPEPADPGETLDDAVEWVEERGTAAATRSARSRVRGLVRETAVRAYANDRSVSEAEAADAVAAGEWTDDRVAAAFVGDERAPRYPLRERLRGWVQPGGAFRRRAERAADAAHALATGEQSGRTGGTATAEGSR